MRKFILGLGLLLNGFFVLAQSGIVSPSPDALGFLKSINSSVSYYTGSNAIDIPLGKVGGLEISVPIDLSYYASGIKVQDIAGSVGLGWSLNAGGMISRVVQGLPDDLQHGYCSKSSITDTEPDLFYYVLPSGKRGKFVLDQNGYPITIPYQNVVISPGICQSNGLWTITDDNGVKYTFGKSVLDIETTYVTPNTTDGGPSYNFKSSWHLSEMNSPNGTERITFSYSTSNLSDKNFYFQLQNTNCTNGAVIKDFGISYTSTVSSVSSIMAYSVVGSNLVMLGSASLGWTGNRLDNPNGTYLSTIQFNDSQLQQLSKYKFQYNYFQSNGCSSPDCYRLRLDKIFDLAPNALYSFLYNTSVNLPSRYSPNFDHWGYYNANTVNSWIPLTPGYYESGASRDPDPVNSSANILTEVDNRGGASQQFLYGTHTAGNTGTDVIVGGVRVRAVVVNDGLGNSYTRSFKYFSESNAELSSGYLFRTPVYLYTSNVSSGTPGGGTRPVYWVLSHSLNDIYDLDGGYIGYSRVDETITGAGHAVYYFTNYDSNPDVTDASGRVTYLPWQRGNLTTTKIFDSNGNLLKVATSTYNFTLPNRGGLLYAKYIAYNFSCTGTSKTQNYSLVSQAFTLSKVSTDIYDPTNSSKKMTKVSEFTYDANTYQCISTSNYDLNLSNVKYIATTKYASHQDYDFNAAKISYCGNQFTVCNNNCSNISDPQASATCYSNCSNAYSDCTSNSVALSPEMAAIQTFRNRNQINSPIEMTIMAQNGGITNVIASQVNLFSTGTGSIVNLTSTWAFNQPVDVSVFQGSSANFDGTLNYNGNGLMRAINTYDSYDPQTGTLLQKTSLNGIQTGYTWDTKKQITKVATNPSGFNRATNYTNKQMVGPTSFTDANNVVTSYVYDIYNRLNMIKDTQGNIIKRYRYQYSGETPGFVITASSLQPLLNASVTFYINDIASSVGTLSGFTWDFGDGTVVSNGGTSPVHTYTSSGPYTVSVTTSNPEYGQITRSIQINVPSPPSVSICANGAVGYDVCGLNPPTYGDCTSSQNGTPSVTLTATPGGGCGTSYSYNWTYQLNSINYTIGTGSSVNFNPVLGSYTVTCTLTDACGNTASGSIDIEYYKSNSSCIPSNN